MSDSDVLTSPSLPDAKQQAVVTAAPVMQQAVVEASDAKQQAIGIPTTENFHNAAIGRNTGSGVASSSGIEHDLNSLSYGAIADKYGPEAVARLTAAQNAQRWQNSGYRTDENIASDAVSGFGLSTINLVGGIANFGAGLVSPKTAVWGAKQMEDFGNFVHGTQSPDLQNRRQAEAERNALAARDFQAQHDEDVKKDGSFVAGLKQIGRGVLDTVSHLLSDPVLASDATFEGLGSLLTAGPMAKGIGLGARGLGLTGAREALGTRAAVSSLYGNNAAMESLATLDKFIPGTGMAALGVQEGTGAFNEAVTDVANMPQEELDKSPYYQSLVKPVSEGGQGMRPEDARALTARNQGLAASVPAALGGMAMSRLTGMDKIVHDPFHAPGLGTFAKHTAQETAFEGGQLGTSTVSRNLAEQQYADPEKPLFEGVGPAIAQGAVAGFGGGLVTMGPQAVGHAALDVTKATGNAVLKSVGDRADAFRRKNEADSPVSDAKVRTAVDQAAATAPEAEAVMKDAVDKSAAPPEQKTRTGAAIDRLLDANKFDPAGLDDPQVPEILKTVLGGATDRLDAMHKLAAAIKDPDISPQDRLTASFAFLGQHDLLTAAMPDSETLDSLPEDHAAVKLVDDRITLLKGIKGSPTVSKALMEAKKRTAEANAPTETVAKTEAGTEAKTENNQSSNNAVLQPVSEASLPTPEGRQNLLNNINMAHYEPDKADIVTNKQILDLADAGKITLTDAQRSSLEASNAILTAAKEASEAQAKLGHKNLMGKVSDQIQVSSDRDDPKLSAMSHVAGITQAIDAGNPSKAAKLLSNLGEFVQHMSNKVGALNQHYEQGGGDKVAFQAINPESRRWYQTTGNDNQAVHPTSRGSIEYAQTVALEAKRLADIHNGLARAYPALGAKELTPAALHEALQGKPVDVAKAFQTGERVRPPLGSNRTREQTLEDIRSNGIHDMEGLRALNDHLETIPEYDRLRLLEEAGDNKVAYSDLTGNIVSAVKKILENASKAAGIKDISPLVRLIKATVRADRENGGTGGHFSWKGEVMGLAKASMDRFNAGEIKFRTLAHVVLHELSHAIDLHGGEYSDSMARDGKLIDGKWTEPFVKDGALWKEFFALKGKTPGLNNTHFDYLDKFTDPSQAATELFAEIGAFTLAAPALARKLIPDGSKAFETALISAAAFRGLGEARLDDRHDTFYGRTDDDETPVVSRISAEDAKALTAGELKAQRDPLIAKAAALRAKDEELSAADSATLRVLDTETFAREDAAAKAEAEAAAARKANQQTDTSKRIKAMDEAYPGLLNTKIGDKVVNWFKQTFFHPKEASTRLTTAESPFQMIGDALAGEDSFQIHVGSETKTPISKETAAAYSTYLNRGLAIVKAMQNNLDNPKNVDSQGKPLAWLEKYLEGDIGKLLADPRIFRGYTNTKILNIAEMSDNGNGRLTYNTHLLESAVLAGLQWILIGKNSSAELDNEDLAKIFDVPEEGIDSGILNHMNDTVSHTEAVHMLTQKITDYWGLHADPQMADGLTIGIPEAVAKEVIRAMIQTGMLQKSVVVRHADGTLAQLWGDKGDDGRVKGLKNSKGKDIDLENTDTEELSDDAFAKNGQFKSFNRLALQDFSKEEGLAESLSLIEKAVLVTPKDVNHFGQDPIEVATTQMNNRAVENSPEQMKAIEKNQNTEHFPNMHNIDLHLALGADNVVDLFGAGALDKELFNENDLKSKEGVNVNIRSAFNTMKNLVAELRGIAAARGIENPADLPVRWGFNFSKVGRLQMLGRFSPQASKLMRELFLPTRDTLDLSGANPLHARAFDIALAQALGEKVHAMHFNEISDKVNHVDEVYAKSGLLHRLEPTVKLLADFIEHQALPTDMVQQIKANFAKAKVKLTPVALHALMEFARLQLTEDASQFQTHLYLEADGVTNGPMNGMVLLATGRFSADQLAKLAKGGLFTLPASHGPRSMNEQRSGINPEDRHNPDGSNRVFEPDKTDLYQTASDIFDHIHGALRAGLEKDARSTDWKVRNNATKVLTQLGHLMTVMSALIPAKDLSYDPMTKALTISRGVMKNPLTITLYGSGNLGIAGKLVGQMVEEVYARLSKATEAVKTGVPGATEANTMFSDAGTPVEAVKKYRQFWDAMDALHNNIVKDGRFGLYVKEAPLGYKGNNGPLNAQTFTFTKAELANLKQNILHLVVVPMAEGIRHTVGDTVIDASKLVIKATSVQSIFLKYAFQREIRNALDEKAKEPGYEKTDFLSRVEQDKIFKKLSYLFPFIKTGEQTFYPAGKESTSLTAKKVDPGTGKEVKATSFSADLADRQGSAAFVYAPANSGVGGMPMLIIGMGDGMMMQYDSTHPDGTMHNLPVFDGNNGRLSTIKQDGQAMNRAVWASWQGNPLMALHDSFSAFMKAAPQEPITDAMAEELAKSLKLGKKFGDDMIHLAMAELADALHGSALEAEARHQALNEFALHIDQMAAADAPFEKSGRAFQGTAYAKIAVELNRVYEQKLAELQKAAGMKTAEAEATAAEPIAEPIATASPPTAAAAGQPASAGSVEAVKPAKPAKPDFGTRDKASGSVVLTGTALSKLLKVSGLSPVMQALYNQVRIAKVISPDGYKVVTGTLEQLQAYAKSRNLDDAHARLSALSTAGTTHGITNFNSRTIFLIGEPQPETIIHELIHAATLATVMAVLSDRQAHPDAVAAVHNLQDLMDEFMALDTGAMDDKTLEAYRNALAAIDKQLNDPALDDTAKTATALNEFMAWNLANRHLAERETGNSPDKGSILTKIVKGVMSALRSLLFGKGKTPLKADDMLSRMLFNTNVIIRRSQPTLQAKVQDTNLYMSTVYGNSERLAKVNQTFYDQIVTYLTSDKITKAMREPLRDLAQAKADKLAKLVITHGFDMTPQESTTFKSIVTALATEATIDPASMSTAEGLYAHVVKHITPGSFMPSGMNESDPEWSTAWNYAEDKWKTVVGKNFIDIDKSGRSSLMPVFLGLATVNDEFRQVLADMPMPRSLIGLKGQTLDGVIENVGSFLLDQLSHRLSGTNKSLTIKNAIDDLAEHIHEIAQERQTVIDQLASAGGSWISRGDQIMAENISALAEAAAKAGEGLEARHKNLFTKAVRATTGVFAAIVNEERGEHVARGITTTINTMKGFTPLTDLVANMIGRTASNKGVYDLIKLVKRVIDRNRQQFRTDVPKIIQGTFITKPTEPEWSSLFRGMAKTGLAALANSFKLSDILGMLQDRTLVQDHIERLENELRAKDPTHWPLLKAKAEQLANHMLTDQKGRNLLRNAEAVSKLLNERTQRGRLAPDIAFIGSMDHLITLYALNRVSRTDRETMAHLAEHEPKGMHFVLSYLVGQHVEETTKAANGFASALNHYKGYVPSVSQPGVSMIIARDGGGNFERLREQSYERAGDYRGSAAEMNKGRMGYYFAPVNARSPFNQGIAQNVKMTAGGVEQSTGYTEGLTAGRITDKDQVREITRALAREGTGMTENLMPIFGEHEEVVAYERSVDPNQLTRLNRDTNLARMVGVWRGRQVEEASAQYFNQRLAHELHDMYQADLKKVSGAQSQYANILNPAELDAVQRDAVSLLSKDFRKYLTGVSGERDTFYVRKDMLLDAFGYRSASVGDAWTGMTRWGPGKQEAVKNMALAVFGNGAYAKLLNSEQGIQEVVKNAKTLIVVKSMVVPMINFMSSTVYMIERGVPWMSIMNQMPRKVAEAEAYQKGRAREIMADAELRAAMGAQNMQAVHTLTAEIQSLQDSYKRLSIWPLLEQGELNTISDPDISTDDLLLTSGKLEQYIEKQVERLPDNGIKTAARYALIGKDTALFKGLVKATEYGDFLAKAITYDDLTKRRGMTSEQALGRITEEYINYDVLPGRFRGYMESMGLMWFYNYKVRAVKTALSQMRENPLRSMLGLAMPGTRFLGGLDTPLTANLFIKGLEGKLDFSLGPMMGLRGLKYNPIIHLLFG